MATARVAIRYAAALMQAAEQRSAVDTVGGDLEGIRHALATSRELQLLVASPVVPPSKKRAILRDLFGTRVGTLTLDFLMLLVAKGREPLLRDIAGQYQRLRDERQGIVTVHVTSAVPLTGAEEQQLRRQLERTTGKTVRLQATVNASIRGGLVIQIGDTVRDASVTRQLELLRERFLTSSLHLN
jgi:F-type H+-transporting ATPase subunit delta